MENSKLKPLQVVERYHERYLEYESAFNNDAFDENKTQEKLKEIANSGISFDSEEFSDAVIDLMIEKPTRRVDVQNAALKFFLYTEFYIMTQEDPLPENIKKDYDNLPVSIKAKPFYSIKDGKFVKNEDVKIDLQKDKLKELFKSLQNN